jgi:hypothetical protein
VKQLFVALAIFYVMTSVCRAENRMVRGVYCRDIGKVNRFEEMGRLSLFTWALGYLSGVNDVMQAQGRSVKDISGLTEDVVIRAISDFCAVHPDYDSTSAILSLWRLLPEVRGRP